MSLRGLLCPRDKGPGGHCGDGTFLKVSNSSFSEAHAVISVFVFIGAEQNYLLKSRIREGRERENRARGRRGGGKFADVNE